MCVRNFLGNQACSHIRVSCIILVTVDSPYRNDLGIRASHALTGRCSHHALVTKIRQCINDAFLNVRFRRDLARVFSCINWLEHELPPDKAPVGILELDECRIRRALQVIELDCK